ncbi:MAG: 3-oxoacyl-ACP reductase family protein [Haloferacaceae archaeon]
MSTERPRFDREEPTTATDRSLRDKTCVVTGASRGIGRAIALDFARRGANVAVNYRSSTTAARQVVETIEADGGRAFAVQADVGDRTDVDEMADRVHDEVGAVDVLVNNAGVNVDRRFDRMTWEDWRRVVEVNLGGAFHCTKAFYEDVRDADQGRLINVSSVVGQRGNYGQSNYAASKSALFGFTRSLALELAPHGSTANCIAPGYTRTDMVERVREDVRERIREQIPLDRFASVEEVACTARFLARDETSYVTGEVINVNGGLYG